MTADGNQVKLDEHRKQFAENFTELREIRDTYRNSVYFAKFPEIFTKFLQNFGEILGIRLTLTASRLLLPILHLILCCLNQHVIFHSGFKFNGFDQTLLKIKKLKTAFSLKLI